VFGWPNNYRKSWGRAGQVEGGRVARGPEEGSRDRVWVDHSARSDQVSLHRLLLDHPRRLSHHKSSRKKRTRQKTCVNPGNRSESGSEAVVVHWGIEWAIAAGTGDSGVGGSGEELFLCVFFVVVSLCFLWSYPPIKFIPLVGIKKWLPKVAKPWHHVLAGKGGTDKSICGVFHPVWCFLWCFLPEVKITTNTCGDLCGGFKSPQVFVVIWTRLGQKSGGTMRTLQTHSIACVHRI